MLLSGWVGVGGGLAPHETFSCFELIYLGHNLKVKDFLIYNVFVGGMLRNAEETSGTWLWQVSWESAILITAMHSIKTINDHMIWRTNKKRSNHEWNKPAHKSPCFLETSASHLKAESLSERRCPGNRDQWSASERWVTRASYAALHDMSTRCQTDTTWHDMTPRAKLMPTVKSHFLHTYNFQRHLQDIQFEVFSVTVKRTWTKTMGKKESVISLLRRLTTGKHDTPGP